MKDKAWDHILSVEHSKLQEFIISCTIIIQLENFLIINFLQGTNLMHVVVDVYHCVIESFICYAP